MMSKLTSSFEREAILEYNLSIAFYRSRPCSCSEYLIKRRNVLLPAMIAQADKEGMDPADTVARFVRGLHAKHS